MANNGMPSMLALLGLLAVAGFQNRDKIGEVLGGLGGAASGGGGAVPPAANPSQSGGGSIFGAPGTGATAPNSNGGLGGMLDGAAGGGLGGLLGGLADAMGGKGTSGGLGDILSSLGGGAAGGAGAGSVTGGLGELMDSFRNAGHGQVANSWVTPGVPTQGLTPQQVEQAIGPDNLRQLSSATGLSTEELLKRLASAIPQTVDTLTPNGQMPTEDQARRNLGLSA